jgi:hypothetical protein
MTFNEFRGHFLTRDEAAEITDCAPSALRAHPDVVSVGGYIPGEELYPALQFDRDGQPTPGLGTLVEQLSQHLADVEIASFCTQPVRELGGKSPIDWLRAGHPVDAATLAALTD